MTRHTILYKNIIMPFTIHYSPVFIPLRIAKRSLHVERKFEKIKKKNIKELICIKLIGRLKLDYKNKLCVQNMMEEILILTR